VGTDRTQRLLAAARATLAGKTTLPPARRARAAAVLARTALEQIINERLIRAGALTGALAVSDEASGRVKLICLRALKDEQARQAAWAWGALSSACHHHSYELAPSVGEVGYLVGVVERL
jgi:hypothetical protein